MRAGDGTLNMRWSSNSKFDTAAKMRDNSHVDHSREFNVFRKKVAPHGGSESGWTGIRR